MSNANKVWNAVKQKGITVFGAAQAHPVITLTIVALIVVWLLLLTTGAGQRGWQVMSGLLRSQVEKKLEEVTKELEQKDEELAKAEKRFEAERRRLRESIAKKDVEIQKRDAKIAEMSIQIALEAGKRQQIEARLEQELAIKRTAGEIHARLATVGHRLRPPR